MNTITVEHMQAVDTLAWHLRRLPREERIRIVADAVVKGVSEGLEARGLAGMGEDDAAVSSAVQSVLTPLLPSLTDQLTKAVEPAAKKAAEFVGPAIEEKIKEYGPTLAIITGIVAGVIALIGSAIMGGVIARKVR
jgi:hypothetical protein